MLCTVVCLSQEVDFEKGEMVTYVTFRLSNGTPFRAAVEDDVAALIMQAQVQLSDLPTPAPVAAPQEAAGELSLSPVEESEGPLGGLRPVQPVAAAPAPPVPVQAQTLANGRTYVPSRTVPRNDAGYPLVPGAYAEISSTGGTGSPDTDEDGVTSL